MAIPSRAAQLAVALAIAAATASCVAPASDAVVVARVNGETITRVDFDAYAAVFEIEGNDQVLPDEYVLLALINQALAKSEAARMGLTVSPALLNEMVAHAETVPAVAAEVRKDPVGFRSRLEVKLLFDAVREAVTVDVRPAEEDLIRYFDQHRADYGELPYETVRFEISTLVEADMNTSAWRKWLADQRACAVIVLVDTRLALPPETYEGSCTTDNLPSVFSLQAPRTA